MSTQSHQPPQNQTPATITDPQPQLLSQIRRNLNSLKQSNQTIRKGALAELLKLTTHTSTSTQANQASQASPALYQQVLHMGLKEIIKCYYDRLESVREGAVQLTIQLLSRCENIRGFLPYILEGLKDRTNCVDLEGIDRLPEKLRPQPGQKPKMMLKLTQQCQQIRILYCQLLKRIIILLQQDKHFTSKYLDDIVNILRALIMDPAPHIQKQACQVLVLFCNDYKDILLHFTESMGRAVLLPLVSKKSSIRIAGLRALTAVLWCGLWKYNAFVFENLIGFRDPNSVPIKDFYQPTNNINYLATLINDTNPKLRQQFLTHLKTWTCDLNDKYDHHSKLVPYLLSGLADQDTQVQATALEAIDQIGRQIQVEREKQFREGKQFAVDAAWTWDGKLVGLDVEGPLKGRPGLGARVFIRGHVRKFWSALYKEIRDLNQQHRIRAANLALYSSIYTQNYLTQYLDNLIPNLLPSILPPPTAPTSPVPQTISRIFHYIGRYCPQSAYLHLIRSTLEGKLIQNEQFIRCGMRGLAMLVKGNLEAVPVGDGLGRKKEEVVGVLGMLQECEIAGEVYNYNCGEVREIGEVIIDGIVGKGLKQEQNQILQIHFLTLIKLLAVSYYQQLYTSGFTLKSQPLTHPQSQSHNTIFQNFTTTVQKLLTLYPQGLQQIQQLLSNVFCSPPSLMDADWKVLVVLYRYFCVRGGQEGEKGQEEREGLFLLVQDAVCETLSGNQSVELLGFTVKFLHNLVNTLVKDYKHTYLSKSTKLLKKCLQTLHKLTPIKKVPIYDQPQLKPPRSPTTPEQTYTTIFLLSSKTLSSYYLNHIPIAHSHLAELLSHYFACFEKTLRVRSGQCVEEGVKTVWAVFERVEVGEGFGEGLWYGEGKGESERKYMLPGVIDFCVARIEENLDSRLNNFVFKILYNITKSWPKCERITDIASKLPHIYPNFPDLLQKLFKYALNQKDIETKQRYMQLFEKLARKMPDWFKYQVGRAQQEKRHEKARLLEEIVHNSNI